MAPAPPADRFPVYFLSYVAIGGLWYLSLRLRGSGLLLSEIRRDLETDSG